MKIEQVAAQLFTCREILKTPPEIAETLKRVRKVGYTAVQVSGMGPIAEEELKRILDGEGLTCCVTHEKADMIRQEPERVIERLKKLDCAITAYPHPAGVDMTDVSSVNRLIADLNSSGAKMAREGIALAYHNHAIEFVRIDGIPALEYIYRHSDPRYLQGEPDTYWIQYGGGDPVAWCRRLKDRLPVIHLKDYVYTVEDKPRFGEIGSGTLDFKAIVEAAESSGCRWFVVEQDQPSGDPVESLAQSFRYIQDHLVR